LNSGLLLAKRIQMDQIILTKLEDNSGIEGGKQDFCFKKGKKRSGIAPLRLPTLASFRTWGI
jgi:hypothetical protein